MVKDHSESERGNMLSSLHGLLFPISSKGSLLYAPSHRQDSTYHNLCYIGRGELAATRNSSLGKPSTVEGEKLLVIHSYQTVIICYVRRVVTATS